MKARKPKYNGNGPATDRDIRRWIDVLSDGGDKWDWRVVDSLIQRIEVERQNTVAILDNIRMDKKFRRRFINSIKMRINDIAMLLNEEITKNDSSDIIKEV